MKIYINVKYTLRILKKKKERKNLVNMELLVNIFSISLLNIKWQSRKTKQTNQKRYCKQKITKLKEELIKC